jgi:hypothetical protein
MIAESLLSQGWKTMDAYLVSWLITIVLSYLVTKFAEPIIRRWFATALKSK